MSRRRSATISCREARDLYLLVGACRALGLDGGAWRRHLVVHLRRLMDADVAFLADYSVSAPPGTCSDWCSPISLIDDGWKTQADRQALWEVASRCGSEHRAIGNMLARNTPIQIGRRNDLIDDSDWYSSTIYREHIAPAGLDHFVICVCNVAEDAKQVMLLQREQGRKKFSRRVVHLLRALWIEICGRQPRELMPVNGSALTALPRRMLQVLACLLAGHTAKETAELLDVSVHTVQEHIRRLYKRSGTRNRAELAECYRHVAPTLTSMTLDELPISPENVNQHPCIELDGK